MLCEKMIVKSEVRNAWQIKENEMNIYVLENEGVGNDYSAWDDDYGRSGEKYGWYNGWSDDVIDDAFDGDPEATWNVD